MVEYDTIIVDSEWDLIMTIATNGSFILRLNERIEEI